MNTKQRKTLRAIFTKPTSATIVFSDIEALIIGLGERSMNARALASRSFSKGNGAAIGLIRAKKPSAIRSKKRVSCLNE